MIAAYTSSFVALYINASAMLRVTALGRKKFISGESPNTYLKMDKGRGRTEGRGLLVPSTRAMCGESFALIIHVVHFKHRAREGRTLVSISGPPRPTTLRKFCISS